MDIRVHFEFQKPAILPQFLGRIGCFSPHYTNYNRTSARGFPRTRVNSSSYLRARPNREPFIGFYSGVFHPAILAIHVMEHSLMSSKFSWFFAALLALPLAPLATAQEPQTPAPAPAPAPPEQPPAEQPPAPTEEKTQEPATPETPAEQPPPEQPPPEQPPAEQPPAEKPAEEKPATEKTSEEQSPSDKPAEEKPAEEKPADMPAQEKPADTKPTEEKPKEEKPAETPAAPEVKLPSESKVEAALPANWIESAVRWRNIGPANMSGRITALTVYEKDPNMWWASSASGGLLKTIDNGVTFEFQFDRESVVSIGDVQVAQSDSNIVWVGTGEANPRNSASWGDGVYKSVDGGKTWKNMGLKETKHIGRIAIDPTNPDIVYVGALGRLWGPNPERGLFKTSDGGKTWEKILFVDDDTGVIDVQMHPTDPNTLFVATYQRRRDGFDGNDPSVRYGAGSAIYRTKDGGKTFEKLTNGLPAAKLGRIGLNIYRKDPNFVYAIVESERIGQWPSDSSYAGLRGESVEVGAKLTEITKDGPAAKAKLAAGDVVVRVDDEAVPSYTKFIELLRRKPAGAKAKLEIIRSGEPLTVEIELERRPEVIALEKRKAEAKTPLDTEVFREGSPFAQSLGGQNPNMADEQGSEGKEFGGVYRSADGGNSWERINSLNPRPMYYSQIRVDPSDNNKIWVLGTELYKSKDGGITFTPDGHGDDVHVDHHAMWIDPRDGRHVILGNDGGIYVTYSSGANWDHHNHIAIGQFYHVGVASNRDYKVYGGLQDNGSWGGPTMVRNNSGPVNGDWMNVGGGDGFICLVDPTDPDQIYSESQNGAMSRRNLRTGEQGFIRPRAPQGRSYRFNWKTPFILSNHNPEIFYAAGNHVFRSVKKGTEIREISPEITVDRQGTGSALSESPLDERVLFAGTTDGQLWVTRDGGQNWINLWKEPERVAAADQGRSGRGGATGPGGPGGTRGGRRGTAGGPPSGSTGGRSAAEAGAPPVGETRAESPDTQTPPPAPASAATPEQKKLEGAWSGTFSGGMMSGERARFQLSFSVNAEGAWTGTYRSAQADGTLENITFDAATGAIEARVATGGAALSMKAKLEGEKVTGEMSVNNGNFQIPFTAERSAATGTESATAADASKAIKDLLPKPMWISSLECSRVAPGRCYVTVDGHRSDVYVPIVLVTENYGRTWRSIRANLPDSTGSAWVLREDLFNADVLYLGTEMATWVSIDRGASWTKLNSNLPTVAVHELAQHPTSGEIVAATHGRSLWIADVSAVRQFSADKMKNAAQLYKPNEVIRWRRMPSAGSSGTRRFVGENPSTDAHLFYSLSRDVQSAELEIRDITGRRVALLAGVNRAGLQKITWDMRITAGATPPTTATTSGRGGAGGGRFGGARVGSGTYQVSLVIDGTVVATESLKISEDPVYSGPGMVTANEQEFAEMLEGEAGD